MLDKIIQFYFWSNPKGSDYADYFYGLSENGTMYKATVPEYSGDELVWKIVGESPVIQENEAE